MYDPKENTFERERRMLLIIIPRRWTSARTIPGKLRALREKDPLKIVSGAGLC